MSAPFRVGEIAIHKPDPGGDPAFTILDGEEVEIIGALEMRDSVDGPYYSYEVFHPAAGDFLCAPHELRRRKPPTTGEQAIRAMFTNAPQRVGEPA